MFGLATALFSFYNFWLLNNVLSFENRKGQGEKCGRKTDITFVVDRSGSIRPGDYDEMRDFLSVVGQDLQIGVRNEEGELYGQGALVTFSEEANVRITLKDSVTPGAFDRLVKNMPGPLPGGRTRTDKGLDLAIKDVLKGEEGFRETEDDVAKILVVITDGEQTQDSKSKYVGDAIRPIFDRGMTASVYNWCRTRRIQCKNTNPGYG